MANPTSQMIQGYEFDTTLEFNDDAIYVLAALSRTGVVYFQVDDSPANVIGQLKKAAEETGYFDVVQHGFRVWVIESEKFELQVIH